MNKLLMHEAQHSDYDMQEYIPRRHVVSRRVVESPNIIISASLMPVNTEYFQGLNILNGVVRHFETRLQ